MKPKVDIKMRSKRINLDHCSGKWVAFISNQPVEWAESLPLLIQKVKKKPLPQEPSFMLVPRKDEGPYI